MTIPTNQAQRREVDRGLMVGRICAKRPVTRPPGLPNRVGRHSRRRSIRSPGRNTQGRSRARRHRAGCA
eukprot:24622-Pleurochrysis_carterae.AAC.1